MASTELLELMERVRQLPVEEQLQLSAYLAQALHNGQSSPEERYAWGDICGIVPYGLLGEDAQEWVSRTRQESDEERAALLRR